MSAAPDVAVIGGGIAGCSVAAFLAEGGARVRLYERAELAAGASGRNSGVLQHPLDEALTGLHAESLEHYAQTLALPDVAGLLVLAADPAALAPERDAVAARFPELEVQDLDDAAVAAAEPSLAPGLQAFRMHTGRPVPPAAATHAFAERARRAGADLRTGAVASLDVRGDRATGVVVGGASEPAGAVVVAAGPWTPAVIDATGGWRPVTPLWGVVTELRLERPPRHVVEEAGIESLNAAGGGPRAIFSMVTADGASAVGSTFLAQEPEPAALVPALRERAARFVPEVARTVAGSVRACARPRSEDGRPLLGPVDGVADLHVLTGHGPWGISLGPGSARLVADRLLGRDAAIPPELDARRFGPVRA